MSDALPSPSSRAAHLLSGAHLHLVAADAAMHPGPVAHGSPEGHRLLTDPQEAALAEQAAVLDLTRQGLPPSFGYAGMRYEDAHLRVFRDPVQFPDGRLGTQVRIAPSPHWSAAVAVLPVNDHGIVLMQVYRHPTRRWHLEAPSGDARPGEPVFEAARRKLHQDTGALDLYLEPLGRIYPCPSYLAWHIETFAARVDGALSAHLDRSKAIASAVTVPFDEIDTCIRDEQVNDAVTLAMINAARTRGAIPSGRPASTPST